MRSERTGALAARLIAQAPVREIRSSIIGSRALQDHRAAAAERVQDLVGRAAQPAVPTVPATPQEVVADSSPGAVDDSTTLSLLAKGQQLAYEFDMGDGWRHLCSVARERVDPHEVYGEEPDVPVPYWGWGDLPDQYGRVYVDVDGWDEDEVPPPPDPPCSRTCRPLVHATWPSGSG